MYIELPFDVVKEDVRDCTRINKESFEYDGEEYVLVDIVGKSRDDHYMYESKVFKRLSDGKHFLIDLVWTIYSTDDYTFEEIENQCELFEVHKEEVTTYRWV